MWVLDALQDGGSGRDTDDLPGGAEQPENSRHGGNVGVWGGRPGQIIFQVFTRWISSRGTEAIKATNEVFRM